MLDRGGQSFFDSAVVVPSTVIELYESNASFSQSAGQQAVSPEGAVSSLGAIEIKDVFGFPGDVHQLGDAHLHAEGEFVLADTCINFRIPNLSGSQSVESSGSIDDVALIGIVDSLGVADVEDWIAGGIEMNPLILSREETAMPLSGGNWLVLSTAGGGHDDEAG